jgi:hypothetical protein
VIERAVAAGLPFAWVTGDELNDDNGPLRTWLETERIRYVLAVSCDHRIAVGGGATIHADALARRVSDSRDTTLCRISWGVQSPAGSSALARMRRSARLTLGESSGVPIRDANTRPCSCHGLPAAFLVASCL